MTQHAKLSASGSAKWILCPGSVKAEEKYSKTSSVYADEGTIAHGLADYCFKKNLQAEKLVGKTIKQLKISVESFPDSYIIEKDMAEYVQEYIDYVHSFMASQSMMFNESRVDFSHVVPEGFGTFDAAIVTGRHVDIFDLKYGKGVIVDAFENTQGQLYAIGLYNELSWMGNIESFTIHIVQPRAYNFSSWDISTKDLLKFAKFAQERANLALTDNAPRIPGNKQCEWCKAASDCKALAKFTEDIIRKDFDGVNECGIDQDSLTKDEKSNILLAKPLIEKFLKLVEGDVFQDLQNGSKYSEFKLVEGRSNRQFVEEAEQVLVDKLGEKAYNKKLIGLGEAEKLLGKKEISEITFKPKGSLTLAHMSDKRKAVKIDNVFGD